MTSEVKKQVSAEASWVACHDTLVCAGAQSIQKWCVRVGDAKGPLVAVMLTKEVAHALAAAPEMAAAREITNEIRCEERARERIAEAPLVGDVYLLKILLDMIDNQNAALREYHSIANSHADLVKALEFYADGKNWLLNGPCDPNSGNFQGQQFAQQALAKVRP